MATKLASFKTKFSGIVKEKGTGANLAEIMKPVSESDVTPWNRKRSYQGTKEFDAQFQIPEKPVYSDNEVEGAKMLAKNATEAAKNKGEVVKCQTQINKASEDWYKADQELVRNQATHSLGKFQEKLKTQELLDSHAPQYMNSVSHYGLEYQGALTVISNIEKSMSLK